MTKSVVSCLRSDSKADGVLSETYLGLLKNLRLNSLCHKLTALMNDIVNFYHKELHLRFCGSPRYDIVLVIIVNDILQHLVFTKK